MTDDGSIIHGAPLQSSHSVLEWRAPLMYIKYKEPWLSMSKYLCRSHPQPAAINLPSLPAKSNLPTKATTTDQKNKESLATNQRACNNDDKTRTTSRSAISAYTMQNWGAFSSDCICLSLCSFPMFPSHTCWRNCWPGEGAKLGAISAPSLF